MQILIMMVHMDMVINNINDEALLYRNTSRDKDTINNHFLQIKFKGDQTKYKWHWGYCNYLL